MRLLVTLLIMVNILFGIHYFYGVKSELREEAHMCEEKGGVPVVIYGGRLVCFEKSAIKSFNNEFIY